MCSPKLLTPFIRRTDRKGMAIPLVVIVLFVGMAMVALYTTTLRGSRALDTMQEEDLKSLYIAEAGARLFTAGLRSRGRWENRPWKGSSSYAAAAEFGYQSESTRGSYQVFAEEIWTAGEFSHVFVLLRGILEAGLQDSRPRKNVTILKTSLRWSPPPPAPEGVEQQLIASPSTPLNQESLLRFIEDERVRKAFFVDGQIPPEYEELIQFLEENSLADLDFVNDRYLLRAAARIESINEQVEKMLDMLRLAADPDRDLRIAKLSREFQSAEPPDSFLGSLGEPIDILSQIPANGEGLKTLKQMFEDLDPKNRSRVEKAMLIEKLRSLEDRQVHVDNREALPFGLSTNATSRELANEIEKLMLASDEPLESVMVKLSGAGVRLDLGAGASLGADSFAWMIEPEIRPDRGLLEELNEDGSPSQPVGESSIPTKTEAEETSESEYDENPEDTTSQDSSYGNTTESTLPDENDWSNDNIENAASQAITQLYGSDPDSMFSDDIHGPDAEKSINTGLRKVFHDILHGELRRFALRKQLALGRGPSEAELEQFKANNPIPDANLVRKVGNALDEAVASNQFSFHQNAHVTRLGSDQVRHTRMEIPRESFTREVLLKLETLPDGQRPRNNEEFMQMFENSTWGDDATHFSVGVARDENNQVQDSRWLIEDESSGEERYLSDYLQEQVNP